MYNFLINSHYLFKTPFSWKKTTGGFAYWASTGACLSRFLCMHKILVHAQHFVHAQGRLFFCWVPALVPGPNSACTRVLCMHKSVVHARESCACTRILTNKTYQDVPRRTKTYQDVSRRTKTYQFVFCHVWASKNRIVRSTCASFSSGHSGRLKQNNE